MDFVYEVTEHFPKQEMFALISQFRRAAVSILLNIGEGCSGTKKEFINFLRISNRSLRECVVCTTIALRRNYINTETNNRSRTLLVEIAKLNSGLINSLKNPIDKRKHTIQITEKQLPINNPAKENQIIKNIASL